MANAISRIGKAAALALAIALPAASDASAQVRQHAPIVKHHSKLKGAAAGAAAGHMLGHHAVAGAVMGAMVQHHRNKTAQ